MDIGRRNLCRSGGGDINFTPWKMMWVFREMKVLLGKCHFYRYRVKCGYRAPSGPFLNICISEKNRGRF